MDLISVLLQILDLHVCMIHRADNRAVPGSYQNAFHEREILPGIRYLRDIS